MTLSALVGILVAISWPGSTDSPDPESSQSRITQDIQIQLMTSLPIIWGEQASMENVIAGTAAPAPIYRHLQNRYQVTPVDSLEALGESGTDIVILAQPYAMDPADIAVVDSWIRAGGRAIILTDPMLVWHSDFPLGDKRRPLVTGLLSPLLDHWGLKLLAPDEESRGRVELEFSDVTITTIGIGVFQLSTQRNDQAAKCELGAANVIAHCRIGDGRAILFADADFLNEDLPDGDGAGFANEPEEKDRGNSSASMQLIDSMIMDLQK